jgi:uncharacterized protein
MISESEFFEKVKGNQTSEVKNAVRENPSLANARDANGISAVLMAIYRGYRDLAAWLADNGAALNFFEACALGRSAAVRQMIDDNPGLISAYSPDGFQGLGLACFFGHAQLVEELLRAGANPNSASRNPMKVAPIHSAAANRDPQTALTIVRMLLDYGAEPNVTQHGGVTPLHEGAAHGNIELVRLLLERGADRNAAAENGKTALDLAADGNHSETVAVLKAAT